MKDNNWKVTHFPVFLQILWHMKKPRYKVSCNWLNHLFSHIGHTLRQLLLKHVQELSLEFRIQNWHRFCPWHWWPVLPLTFKTEWAILNTYIQYGMENIFLKGILSTTSALISLPSHFFCIVDSIINKSLVGLHVSCSQNERGVRCSICGLEFGHCWKKQSLL